jgi:dehydrogenase/reductase SDR family protein 4
LPQKNVDVAAEKLRAKGIDVFAVVCHVSNAQQRKDLIDKTVQVSLINFLFYSLFYNL